ncbi:hypothetical protein [Klebsiella oxytoca]|uniref:Uncharacterized protein n=1 Tax=Klebsiella oxytoca TaxID=571 RepID=A0A6B8MUG0_KLEOX|nr:hypothetical protein [Klebsiella oxytoca]QGN37167.1 hypothetical protein GJ746_07540 [Klebsiella oxytoca]
MPSGVINSKSQAAILARNAQTKMGQPLVICWKNKHRYSRNYSARVNTRLNFNPQLMEAPGANIAPAIYYMNKENTLQQAIVISDIEKLLFTMEQDNRS